LPVLDNYETETRHGSKMRMVLVLRLNTRSNGM